MEAMLLTTPEVLCALDVLNPDTKIPGFYAREWALAHGVANFDPVSDYAAYLSEKSESEKRRHTAWERFSAVLSTKPLFRSEKKARCALRYAGDLVDFFEIFGDEHTCVCLLRADKGKGWASEIVSAKVSLLIKQSAHGEPATRHEASRELDMAIASAAKFGIRLQRQLRF